MAADDLITLDELRARLAKLDTTRRIVVHVAEAGLWAATLIQPWNRYLVAENANIRGFADWCELPDLLPRLRVAA